MSKGGEFRVHPLVVIAIADHHLRENSRTKGGTIALGAVVGLPGEAVATLPIVFKANKGKITFDDGDLKEDLSLYRALKPEHKIIGWYSTQKGKPQKEQVNMTRKFAMLSRVEPIYINLDPEVRHKDIDVPIKVYREKSGMMIQIKHNLNPDMSEKVAVDYAVQAQDAPDMSTEGSIVTDKYTKLIGSIRDMMSRVVFIQDFLKDTKDWKGQEDQEVLREIRTLCNRLPIMDKNEFRKHYLEEQKNGKLLRLVGDFTKATHNLCWTMDSYNPHCDTRPNHAELGGFSGIDMGGLGNLGMVSAYTNSYL
jgi:COP9 signalosome complex subunit 6